MAVATALLAPECSCSRVGIRGSELRSPQSHSRPRRVSCSVFRSRLWEDEEQQQHGLMSVRRRSRGRGRVASSTRGYRFLTRTATKKAGGLAVAMAPDEEKMTRRSPLDFPVEWDRPSPGRRPDIFPQFSPMKTPLPPPLPADPPEEDEEEEEKKEEDPEKEDKPEE